MLPTIDAVVRRAMIPAVTVAALLAITITERSARLAVALVAAIVATPTTRLLTRRLLVLGRTIRIVDRRLRINPAWLWFMTTRHHLASRDAVAWLIIALIVAEVVGVGLLASELRAIALELAMVGVLLGQLFPVRHYDPIIVLGMLEIALGQHRVPGRLCIAGKLDVFLGDMHGIAADFDIRPVRLKTARERVLRFSIVVVVAIVAVLAVVATAAPAHMLLSLPHAHHVSIVVNPKLLVCYSQASVAYRGTMEWNASFRPVDYARALRICDDAAAAF